MRLDPAMAGIAATGITKLLETNIGDKIIHHTANRTMEDNRHLHNDEFGDKNKKNQSQARSNSTNSRASKQRSTSSSSSSNHNPDPESEKPWSRRSYWKSSRHQQRPSSEKRESPHVWHSGSDSDEGDSWSRKSYWRSKRHQQKAVPRSQHPQAPQYQAYTGALSRDEQQERERRRESFREVKSRYVPALKEEEEEQMGELHWEEERLYADIGQAVREATRRSSSVGRERPGREMRGGHLYM